MYICYIDEAGCPGWLPSPTSDVQPILVLTGLFLPQKHLIEFTRDFLFIKAKFNPTVASGLSTFMDIALHEIKGADLRRDIRKGSRNQRRRTFGFLDNSLDLLDKYNAKLVARIYIKEPGGAFNGRAVYTSSVQNICTCFQHFLAENNTSGLVVADSRTPGLNSIVSHSIFTQKFKANGDSYPNILEMPVFGHSENHAVIQLTDYLCSAMLFPSASSVYCSTHVTSVHVNPKDILIKERYMTRLKNISYRYHDSVRYRGGITVIDAISKRNSSLLLR